MNLLHSADADAMTAYCCKVVRLESAEKALAAEGVLVDGRDGRVRNPAYFVAAEAAGSVRRIGREFGLTPSGRADMRHAPPPGPPGAGTERLLT